MLGQWDYRLPAAAGARERGRGVGAPARASGCATPATTRAGCRSCSAARLGRSFELYRPRQNARMEAFYEGRDLTLAQVGTAMFYVLALLAAVGAVALRRRGAAWAVLAAPIALVALTTLISYGFTRFRVAAEPGLVVLAAAGGAAVVGRLRQRAATGGASSRMRARAVAASDGS